MPSFNYDHPMEDLHQGIFTSAQDFSWSFNQTFAPNVPSEKGPGSSEQPGLTFDSLVNPEYFGGREGNTSQTISPPFSEGTTPSPSSSPQSTPLSDFVEYGGHIHTSALQQYNDNEMLTIQRAFNRGFPDMSLDNNALGMFHFENALAVPNDAYLGFPLPSGVTVSPGPGGAEFFYSPSMFPTLFPTSTFNMPPAGITENVPTFLSSELNSKPSIAPFPTDSLTDVAAAAMPSPLKSQFATPESVDASTPSDSPSSDETDSDADGEYDPDFDDDDSASVSSPTRRYISHTARHLSSRSSSTGKTKSPFEARRGRARASASSTPKRFQGVMTEEIRIRYTCPECGYYQQNHRKPDLNRHKKTHGTFKTEQWVCRGELGLDKKHHGGCGRAFSRRDALKRHFDNGNNPCHGELKPVRIDELE